MKHRRLNSYLISLTSRHEGADKPPISKCLPSTLVLCSSAGSLARAAHQWARADDAELSRIDSPAQQLKLLDIGGSDS